MTAAAPSRFVIGAADFELDGRPLQIISGALHYFRVHPDQWQHRIRLAAQMGLNAIETYVAWNFHSSRPGEFRTDGARDLARFLALVQEAGLFAIVRPGPYICAEWDNGGLPAWLTKDPAVGVRQSEPRYLDAVTAYLTQVNALVAPLQIDRGGPVILYQIENEYGAYGDDKPYLRALVERVRADGITVPLTSIDQPTDEMLANGTLPELHTTASFGSRSLERLATLREHQPTGPLMCAEFWDGWFDHWGAHHHTAPLDQSVADLDAILGSGASVNIYMFHGGTNFGFTNGANDKGSYQPTVTSYDYDAPLAEDGRPTAKYFAYRDTIAKYAVVPPFTEPAPDDAPAFTVRLTRAASVIDPVLAAEWLSFDHLPTMDEAGHTHGFSLYRTTLAPAEHRVLAFGAVRDRAQVFVDGQPCGTLSRLTRETALTLPGGGAAVLDILVEDLGRVNYGPLIGEHKGLVGPATVNGQRVESWQIAAVPLDDTAPALRHLRDHGRDLAPDRTAPGQTAPGPSLAIGHFDLASTSSDLFLDTRTLGKGLAWVNGFLLGRYWSAGPQRTLYVPAPVLRPTNNELVVLELGALASATVEFVARHDLGHTEY